jgi:CHAT domain-containing protein
VSVVLTKLVAAHRCGLSIGAVCPQGPVMYKKIIWLLLLFKLTAITVTGQCLADRDSVKRYIKSVENNSKLSNAQRATILSSYLRAMERCNNYKNDSIHVYLLTSLAQLHYDQSDYIGAIRYVQQCIDMVSKYRTSPALDKKMMLTGYYYKYYFYSILDNFPEKMKAVNDCINVAVELKDSSDPGYIRCLNERAKYNFDLGDYQRCISDAIVCEKVTRNFFRRSFKDAFDTSLTRLMVLNSLGWYVQAQLALQNFSDADKFLEEKTKQYQQDFFNQFTGYLYSFQAQVQMQKGDFTRALSLLQKGLAYSRSKQSNYTCKQILNAIGTDIYLAHYGDEAKAMASYRQALTYRNNNKNQLWDDKIESSNILGNIARLYTRQFRYDSALLYFRYALDAVDKGMTDASFLQLPVEEILRIPKLHYLQNLLLDKADMYLQRNKSGDIAEAIRIYKLADQLLDRMRGLQSDPESKLFWRRNSRRLYEQAIYACYQLNDPVTAFYFFEKSRAVLLSDQLAQQHWMKSKDILTQVQLKRRINALHRDINKDSGDAEKRSQLEQELFKTQQELDNLDQLIRTQNPLYAQLGDTTCPTLSFVQERLLKDHAGLLEIFSGDGAVYTLFTTASKATLRKINKNDFENTVAAYMSFISDHDRLNRDFAGFQTVSRNLYKLIFQDNTVPDGRIIISPDGPLFPFESLVTSTANPVSYFIATHAVSYTYSARYLLNHFMSTSSRSSGILLGVAPVQYYTGSGLAALNGSDVSLGKLSSYFSYSSQLINKQALRRSFLQQFPSYKIIQLYTHAADSSDRNEPLIYFADSALYLSDLVPEQVPATQLIVLSACNTGNGQLYRGEGVFSFNRGFAAMGIPSSVSNLWAIDNVSTYQLTEYFYKYLAKGLPIDVALQQAKLEFLQTVPRSQQLPYHWAPAILVGNTDPVAYPKKGGFQWILLLIAAAGIGFIGWRSYVKKEKSS